MVDEVVAQARRSAAGDGVHVLDLYAGSGLFALPLAIAGHTVTAVEENRQAVKDGIANARSTGFRRRASRLSRREPRTICGGCEPRPTWSCSIHRARDVRRR